MLVLLEPPDRVRLLDPGSSESVWRVPPDLLDLFLSRGTPVATGIAMNVDMADMLNLTTLENIRESREELRTTSEQLQQEVESMGFPDVGKSMAQNRDRLDAVFERLRQRALNADQPRFDLVEHWRAMGGLLSPEVR